MVKYSERIEVNSRKERRVNGVKKILLVITLLPLLSISQLLAQQKIDPVLQVERSFDSRLLEISKSRLESTFHDSLKRFNLDFDYSIFDKPIANLYEFRPIAPAPIESEERVPSKSFSFLAGANWPLNLYASTHYSPVNRGNFSIPISASYSSHFAKLGQVSLVDGNVKGGEDLNFAPHSNKLVEVEPTLRWKDGEIGVRAGYSRSNFSFWGSPETHPQPSFLASNRAMKDSLSNHNEKGYIALETLSRNPNHNALHYHLRVGYSIFNTRTNFLSVGTPYQLNEVKGQENKIDLKLKFAAGFADYNKIELTTHFQTLFQLDSKLPYRKWAEIYPRYCFTKGKWLLSLGLKYSRWWIEEDEQFNIYFSGSAEVELIKNRVWFYASMDGQNELNTYEKLMELAPWVAPNPNIESGEKAVIAKSGVKALIAERLSLNLFLEYNEYRDRPFFQTNLNRFNSTEEPINSLTPIYRNQHIFKVGTTLSYQSKSFDGILHGEYRGYNKKIVHYDSPNYLFNALLRYNWRERIIVSNSWNFKGGRRALMAIQPEELTADVEMEDWMLPSYLLGSLSLSYKHNNNITFSLNFNNILNSTIVEYGTYQFPKFNGGASILLSF